MKLQEGEKVLVLNDNYDSVVRCYARLRLLPAKRNTGELVWQGRRATDDFLIDKLVLKDEGIVWARGWDNPDVLLASFLLAMS